MGSDTLLLDFYGLILIHLIGPLSQVVQTVYVWYIYIREKDKVAILFYYVFLFGTEEENVHEQSLQSTHIFWM